MMSECIWLASGDDFRTRIIDATTTSVKSLGATWSARIQLRSQIAGYTAITLATTFPRELPVVYDDCFYSFDVGVLKSNLQKAIRRRNVTNSVATIRQLMSQSLADALRRYPIIMCEDSVIQHSRFPYLVWLMCAITKGWNIREADKTFIVKSVSDLAVSPVRYVFHEADPAISPEALQEQWTLRVADDQNVNSNHMQIAFSLWVRVEYGGMSGDMAMLRLICSRFINREVPSEVFSEVQPLDVLSGDLPGGKYSPMHSLQ